MSTIGDVITNLITVVETTSVVVAHDGFKDKDSTFPYAIIHMDDFVFDIEIDSTYDIVAATSIVVTAKSIEAVRTAGPEIVSALLDTTSVVYSATDLFNIQPGSMNMSINHDSSNSEYEVLITFRTQIRFTI